MARLINFGAGPGGLPEQALRDAQAELLEFEGSGASIMEHSHRGKVYDAVHAEVLERLHALLQLPPSHAIILHQGGASAHFANVPLAFLPAGRTAGYVINGTWGRKAFSEATCVQHCGGGLARVLASSEDAQGNAVRTVTAAQIGDCTDLAYVHYTSNETIHGIEYPSDPAGPFGSLSAPLVCDVSSNFLARPYDYSRHAFAYAGAQKNVGPSGLVVLVVDRSFVASGRNDLPRYLRYSAHLAEDSRLNTPPTFAVYMMRNVLRWLESVGGLVGVAERNRLKASYVYAALDAASAVYRCDVPAQCRSEMNVVFHLRNPELEPQLLKQAELRGMLGLKGHRSLGGLRASLYNAVEPHHAQQLGELLAEFAARVG
jgi:phosphoserine aminotransferase